MKVRYKYEDELNSDLVCELTEFIGQTLDFSEVELRNNI